MAGVVRPRGELVDQQLAIACQEKLDAKRPDVIERLCNAPCDLDRVTVNFLANDRRCERYIENMVGVRVLDNAEMGETTILAAGANDRNFFLKIYERF